MLCMVRATRLLRLSLSANANVDGNFVMKYTIGVSGAVRACVWRFNAGGTRYPFETRHHRLLESASKVRLRVQGT